MKASELIKRLQEIERRKGGNCPCYVNILRQVFEEGGVEMTMKPIDKINVYATGLITFE